MFHPRGLPYTAAPVVPPAPPPHVPHVSQSLVPPPPHALAPYRPDLTQVPPEQREAAMEYDHFLARLTFNSKDLITSMTRVAGENQHNAAAIVSVLEQRVFRSPAHAKLPFLYLLDSIVKNIGGVFIGTFARNLVHTFMGAYAVVEAQVRRSMDRLLNTWMSFFGAELVSAIKSAAADVDARERMHAYVQPLGEPSGAQGPPAPLTLHEQHQQMGHTGLGAYGQLAGMGQSVPQPMEHSAALGMNHGMNHGLNHGMAHMTHGMNNGMNSGMNFGVNRGMNLGMSHVMSQGVSNHGMGMPMHPSGNQGYAHVGNNVPVRVPDQSPSRGMLQGHAMPPSQPMTARHPLQLGSAQVAASLPLSVQAPHLASAPAPVPQPPPQFLQLQTLMNELHRKASMGTNPSSHQLFTINSLIMTQLKAPSSLGERDCLLRFQQQLRDLGARQPQRSRPLSVAHPSPSPPHPPQAIPADHALTSLLSNPPPGLLGMPPSAGQMRHPVSAPVPRGPRIRGPLPSSAPMPRRPPPSVPAVSSSVPSVLRFSDLKTMSHASAVRSLYTDLPFLSKSDGMRFASQDRLRDHLDWLFKRNRSKRAHERGWAAGGRSRCWFDSLDVFLMKENADGPGASRAAQGREGSIQSGAQNGSTKTADDLSEADARLLSAIPAQGSAERCAACQEELESFWDDGNSSWMLKDATRSDDGEVFHRKCWEDLSMAERPEETLPEVASAAVPEVKQIPVVVGAKQESAVTPKAETAIAQKVEAVVDAARSTPGVDTGALGVKPEVQAREVKSEVEAASLVAGPGDALKTENDTRPVTVAKVESVAQSAVAPLQDSSALQRESMIKSESSTPPKDLSKTEAAVPLDTVVKAEDDTPGGADTTGTGSVGVGEAKIGTPSRALDGCKKRGRDESCEDDNIVGAEGGRVERTEKIEASPVKKVKMEDSVCQGTTT